MSVGRLVAPVPGAPQTLSWLCVHFSKLPASPLPLWQIPHFAFRMKREISLEIQGLNSLTCLNNPPQQACSASYPRKPVSKRAQTEKGSVEPRLAAARSPASKQSAEYEPTRPPHFQAHSSPSALFQIHRKHFLTNSFIQSFL